MTLLYSKTCSELEFENLFNTYKGQVYTHVFLVTKSRYAAEEITQEIFIKLWQHKDSLPEVKNMDGYLYTIAKNHSLNFLRKAASDLKMTNELMRIAVVADFSMESELQVTEYKKLIGEAVESLSPQRKIVYQLSREQGLSYDEIAARLNLSKNTVKNHLLSSVELVRAYLHRNGVDSTIISILFFNFC
ncbi:RNA polymerase sigma-70 factor [Pedobacter sp. KBW06]|uniref:RNA polymerase sigma factor n=1 Tax=Pedobacter sp. KBW06 TaxID=2153359 RepID=UPI000F5A5F26|nr:RNA polymerase sigma-70 factor [Pedobacter sp. KBW06]RQO66428.1 RNA polymerase sigma-70 factor [Pedobacter sp. KBW06]